MKASHNTFSYLRANLFWELISPWWRCQDLEAKDQEVDLIDIRVNINKEGQYRNCHGSIKFGDKFSSLDGLLNYCWKEKGKKIMYRLLFSNDTISLEEATTIYSELPDSYKELCHSCIYQPTWKYIYQNKSLPKIAEHNKHMWYKDKSFWYNITHFLFPTIKKYAEKHNKEGYVKNKINMYDFVQY